MVALKKHRVKIPHQVLSAIRRANKINNDNSIEEIAITLFGINETLAMFWIWLHKEEYLLGLKNGFKGIRGLKTKTLLVEFNDKYEKQEK